MILNPYHPLLGSGRYLPFGRDDVARQITNMFSSSPPGYLELHGLPEVGKSTLLRHIAGPDYMEGIAKEWLQGEFRERPNRLLRLYIGFQGLPASVHPFTYLYQEFHRWYQDFTLRMIDQHSIELPTMNQVEGVKQGNADKTLEMLQRDIQVLVEAGFRPVFLLDDFDRAFAKLEPAQTIRLSSWREISAFVFATEQPLHEVNREAVGSPFVSKLPRFYLSPLLLQDAARFLLHPAQQLDLSFPDSDVNFILNYAGGFPYLLLIAGNTLWEIRNKVGILTETETPLPENHRRFLVGRLKVDFSRSFNVYWDYLDRSLQMTLQSLLSEGVASLDNGNLSTKLSILEAYGLVEFASSGGFKIFSPLFAHFISSMTQASPSLTGLQASLYNYFRSRPRDVCTFAELGRDVWGLSADEFETSDLDERRKIQVAISRLRKELREKTGEDIVVVRGQGYQFEPGG